MVFRENGFFKKRIFHIGLSWCRDLINGGASLRWSFGPCSAWGSEESTTISTTHSSLKMRADLIPSLLGTKLPVKRLKLIPWEFPKAQYPHGIHHLSAVY